MKRRHRFPLVAISLLALSFLWTDTVTPDITGLTVTQAPEVEPPLEVAPAPRVPTSRVGQLCQLVNCSASSPPPPPAPAPPKIDQVQGTVTPGSELLVVGSGFGTAPGTVSLSGQFSGGTLTLKEVRWWSDTWVSVIVPSLSGVRDQSATLQVATAGGGVSNAWPVSFIATRDIFWLPSSYVQVVSCRDADERNVCNSFGIAYLFPNIAIDAYHTGWIFGASGSDVYSVTLGNGWVLDRFWLSSSEKDFRGKVSGPSGFTPGAAVATLTMNWQYYPIDWVLYNVSITVKGPRGVPFR